MFVHVGRNTNIPCVTCVSHNSHTNLSHVSWIRILSCSYASVYVSTWDHVTNSVRDVRFTQASYESDINFTTNHIHLTCACLEWVIFRVNVGAYVCAYGKVSHSTRDMWLIWVSSKSYDSQDLMWDTNRDSYESHTRHQQRFIWISHVTCEFIWFIWDSYESDVMHGMGHLPICTHIWHLPICTHIHLTCHM